MTKEDLGLWGTEDKNRVAVSLGNDNPNRIIGHVRLTNGGDWVIEGDDQSRIFATPHAAAHAALCFWNGTTAVTT